METWHNKGNTLLSEIRNTDLLPHEIALWFIGQCGFILKSGKKVIMIDPVLNDITDDHGKTLRNYAAPFDPEDIEPDFVFCTHRHIDHLACETVRRIAARSPSTHFIIPAGCLSTALRCGLPESKLIPSGDGYAGRISDGIQFRAFSAAHPDHILNTEDTNMALGYCIELDGIRVVHLGDTYLTARLLRTLEKMESPHIFLPPINGDDHFRAMRDCIGNMEAEEAAKLAVHLKADLSIPTHYDMIMGNTVDPLRFAAEMRLLSPASGWHICSLGERIIYRA